VGSVSFPLRRRLDWLTRRIGSLVGRSGRLLQQLLSRVLLLCVVRIVVVTTKASHCW